MESNEFEKLGEISRGIELNGNCHINYEFFWESLAPVGEGGGAVPSAYSDIGKAINRAFGTFEAFVYKF